MINCFKINYNEEWYEFEIDRISKSYISPLTGELIPFNNNPPTALRKHLEKYLSEIKITLTVRNYDGMSKEELLASIERGLDKQGICLTDYKLGE